MTEYGGVLIRYICKTAKIHCVAKSMWTPDHYAHMRFFPVMLYVNVHYHTASLFLAGFFPMNQHACITHGTYCIMEFL